MNMISTGSFQLEADVSKKQTIAEKFAAAWEKKNAKVARASGLSLMALSLAACGSDDDTASTTSTTATTTTTTTTTTPVVDAAKTLVFVNNVIDTLAGGSGDDTFIGDANTVATAADNADGGAGNDTLKMYASETLPTVTNIEAIEFHGIDDAVNVKTTGATSVKIVNSAVAAAADDSITIASGQKVILDGVTATNNVDITTTGTSLDLTLDSSGTSTTDLDVDLSGSAKDIATLNLTIDGTSGVTAEATYATINDDDDKLTSVVITGTGDATLDFDTDGSQALDTIDASGATGALTITAQDDTADVLTITGGSGNDRIDMGTEYVYAALTPDTIDGGAGTDTLVLDDADIVQTKAQSAVTNIEKIESSSALAAANHNLTKFGVNHFIFGVDSALGATITGTSGLTIETAKAVDDIGATADTIISLTDAAGSGDVVNFIINDQSAANANDMDFTAAGVETFDIDASVATKAINLDLDAAQATTITGKAGSVAAADVTLTFGSGGTVVSSVDFSGTTGLGSLALTLSTSAVSGATVKGTKNGDDVADSSQADNIIFGVGADTYSYTGGAADTVDLGSDSAADIVQFDAFGTTMGAVITNFDATAEDTVQVVDDDVDNAENVISSALASAAALGDNDLTVIDMTVGAAGQLLTGGSEAIADFTDITDVEAYLDEAFSVAASDEAVIILNDGTNSYAYRFLEADTATTMDADEITLIATFNNAIVLSGDTSVVT